MIDQREKKNNKIWKETERINNKTNTTNCRQNRAILIANGILIKWDGITEEPNERTSTRMEKKTLTMNAQHADYFSRWSEKPATPTTTTTKNLIIVFTRVQLRLQDSSQAEQDLHIVSMGNICSLAKRPHATLFIRHCHRSFCVHCYIRTRPYVCSIHAM